MTDKASSPLPDHLLLHQSGSNEWYTPAEYIDLVRKALGGAIDLDPASSALANQTVNATRFFTPEEDGLALDWHGNVFCNPPYGKQDNKSTQGLWLQKAIQEYFTGRVDACVLLLNAAIGNAWLIPAFDYHVCLVYRRIHFVSPNGARQQSTHGNIFVFMGDYPNGFVHHFARIGAIYSPRMTASVR